LPKKGTGVRNVSLAQDSVLWTPFPDGEPLRQVPTFATRAVGRAAGIVEADGCAQAVAWDVPNHRFRFCTNAPHGVDSCEIEPDGSHVWWFDAVGDTGRWLRQPFHGGPTTVAMSGVPAGRMYGVAFDGDGGVAAVAVGVDGETRCYVGVPGGAAAEVLVAHGYLGLVDLTPDGRMLALAGRPDGPSAVGLCTLAPDRQVVWLAGDRGRALWPLEFRHAELLIAVERADDFALATWLPDSGLVVQEAPTFDTEISAHWYGAGRTVLVQQDRHGRSGLHLVDLDRGSRDVVSAPDGTVLDLAVAPDGRIHRLWTRADMPPRVVGTEPVDPPAPGDVTRAELWTGAVHTFLATPPGAGPWPTIFLVHGGPATHDRDCYDPRVEVFTAAGYAVARVNYRGSTGYGARWRHDFGHRVGLAQLDDLAAVRRHLVDTGVTDPARVGLSGYSWGGYLALLAMGVQPADWAAALAAFPIADYVSAHLGTTPALREMDTALFGGTPDEVSQRYRDASPMSYVDSVRGAVLLVSSPSDDRCPADQVERYAAALTDRGVRCELSWVGGGHHSRDSADHAAVMDRMLRFATDVLPPSADRAVRSG
jgi:acylaminoacyl-peptidase